MKILKIITFVLLTFPSFAQKQFVGTYFTSKKDIGFESDIFRFEENGTFSYIFFTCTGRGIGKGNYSIIEGDSLHLQFTDCEKCEEDQQLEINEDSDEILEIDLQIKFWEDENEAIGVNVYFPAKRIGTISDENGHATITIPKFTETQNLRIQTVGYDPVDIKIPVKYSSVKGTVYLKWHWVYDSSDTKTFKLLKWSKSKLKLRRYPEHSITYDRVNSNKEDKLIKSRLSEDLYNLYKEKINTPANNGEHP